MPHDVTSAALLEVLKDVRNEMRHQRTLLLESIDQGRTMEGQLLALHQRLREVKEELEQTIRGEIALLLGSLEGGGS